MITAQAIPRLRRGVQRKFDSARAEHVLLGPEKILLLDDPGNAILELCDGARQISEIIRLLTERFSAEPAQVEQDVLEFIEALREKGFITA